MGAVRAASAVTASPEGRAEAVATRRRSDFMTGMGAAMASSGALPVVEKGKCRVGGRCGAAEGGRAHHREGRIDAGAGLRRQRGGLDGGLRRCCRGSRGRLVALAEEEVHERAAAAAIGGDAGARAIAVAGIGMAALPLGHGDLIALLGQRLAVGGQVHGLAVGEEVLELGPGHARPGADRTGVEVDEGAAGGRVVADAADLLAHRHGAQLVERNARDEEIHGVALGVLAVLGDAVRLGAQHLVGGRRAIGGDDVDGLAGAHFLVHFPHEVEEARVHLGGLVAAPVAQEMIEFVEAGLDVLTVALEDDARGLLGVGVVEVKRPFGCRLGRHHGRRQGHDKTYQARQCKADYLLTFTDPHPRHAKLSPDLCRKRWSVASKSLDFVNANAASPQKDW